MALAWGAQVVPVRGVLVSGGSVRPEGWFPPYLGAAILWLAAAVAVALVSRRLPVPREGTPVGSPAALAETAPGRRTEVALAVLILCVGIGLQFHRLESLPRGVNTDACWSGAWAEAICTGIPYTPIFPLWEGESTLNYAMAAAVCTLGNGSLSLRLPTAVFASLGLVAFFFMVRSLFGPRSALWGTALMALSGCSWLLGRSGWRASTVLLVEPLVIWAAWLAWSRGRRRDYAALGIALAASLNAYGATRILPPTLVALLGLRILASLRDRRRGPRELVRGTLFALVVFLLLAAPVIHAALTRPEDYNGRFHALHQGWDLEQLGENLLNLPVIFFHDARGDDYFIHEPVLERPLAVAAGLGVAWALAWALSPQTGLLLWIMAWGTVAPLLTYPNWNHLILWFVPLVALAGAALTLLERILGAAWGHRGRAAALGLAGLLVAGQAWAFRSAYLGPDRRPVPGISAALLDVGLGLKPFARDHAIHTPIEAFDEGALTYLTWPGGVNPKTPGGRSYLLVAHPYELLHTRPADGRGIAFVIPAHGDYGVFAMKVTRRYPGHGEPVEIRSSTPDHRLLCTVIPVGAEVLTASPEPREGGLRGLYYTTSNWSGPPVRTRVDPVIHPGLLDPTVHSAEWSGRLLVEEPGGTHELATDSDDGSWLWIDGRLVVDNGGEHGGRIRSGIVDLTPGEHELRLRWNDFGGGQIIRLFWRPPDMGELVPIPPEHLVPAGP